MKISMEAMKAEALERMKLLKLDRRPVREFREERTLNLTEQFGSLFWLNEEQEKLVRDWERKTGYLVYRVIHTCMEFGDTLSLLYVSTFQEEWAQDRRNIRDGEALAYVMNLDDDACSEYGYIGIRPMFGVVIREW